MLQIEDLEEKMKLVEGKPYQPIDVVQINDQVVRLAFAQGEYHWHTHESEDEMFYLIKGEFSVRTRNFDTHHMKEGQFLVIPKGEEHAPMSVNGGYILMFEPLKTKSRGD